jgi:hypothetical protein
MHDRTTFSLYSAVVSRANTAMWEIYLKIYLKIDGRSCSYLKLGKHPLSSRQIAIEIAIKAGNQRLASVVAGNISTTNISRSTDV